MLAENSKVLASVRRILFGGGLENTPAHVMRLGILCVSIDNE
jgi:hypothetical protein